MNRKVLLALGIVLLFLCLGVVPEAGARSPIVRGTVVDDLNDAIAGVRITCDEVPDVFARTDENGDFALHFHNEDKEQTVTIWANNQGEGYISCSRVIVVPTDTDTVDPIRLFRLFIRGIVEDAMTGQPIVGARIVVRGVQAIEDTTDSRGIFSIVSKHIFWCPPPGIEVRVYVGNKSYLKRLLVAHPWNVVRI